MHEKIAYAALLTALGTIGAIYEQLSFGLAAKGTSGPFYCKELMSSGGDDSVVIITFSLFFIPLAVRLIRSRMTVSGVEVGLFWCVAVLSVGALLLSSLDCADILYTAFAVPDPYLAALVLMLPLSAYLLWKIRSYQ